MKRAIAAALLTIATPLLAGSQVTASHAAISTPLPAATQVGLEILKRGGNAIDAAVAAELVLGGIGGGGFLIYFDAKSGAVWTLDFREVSPVDAKSDTKLHAATPGFLAGLAAMHEKFGSLKWRSLVEPAIAGAREGSRADLAATLMRIAEFGARDFYNGAMAERFITAAKSGGAAIGHRDLHDYAPVWRAPIRIRFGDYDIFAASPPSSGGLVIGEVLNIIGGLDLAASGFQSVKSLHLLAEAERRASIDRAKYLGDPTNARIPYRDLLSAERAAVWRGSIKVDAATATASLTEPGGQAPLPVPAAAATPDRRGRLSSIAIADAAGNVVSLTTSGGGEFVVPGLGFVLNDAMNDFGASSTPNRFSTGKRPVTSMSPAIVLRNGRPFLALGDNPTTVVQVFVNAGVYKQPLYDAVAAARYQHAEDDQIEYEQALAPKATIDALNAMGHGVVGRESIGDVQALMFSGGRIIAVADPRHSGAAGGY
jgi:gamma-glutamyltranspeptidase/glutathione hydrolase